MITRRERQAVEFRLGRRAFLGAATIGCACCRLSARALAEESPHGTVPHWSYGGEAAPSRWGQLAPAFKTCEIGLQQSPIDLANGITAELHDDLELAYRPIPLRIVNNGHTIQVNAEPGQNSAEAGCNCSISGTRYDLLQFHFHHPSEHLLSGKPFDLELHLVHRSSAGALAVVGVFVRPGQADTALQPIWNAMPREEGPERATGEAINPAMLLPAVREHYRYMGSLTTPPCSEGITWTVCREAIEASPEQIRQFAALFANNARPVQAPNRRFLLQTF